MPSKKYQLTDLATGRKSELAALSGSVGPDVLDISTLQQDQGLLVSIRGIAAANVAACLGALLLATRMVWELH